MKSITSIIFPLLICYLPLVAMAESKLILLEDGTEIVGELVALANGTYTIRTQSLGTIRVSERQVLKITQVNSKRSNPVRSATNSLAGNQIQSIQQRLLSNGDTMRKIIALQTNPDLKAILSDPATMSAIQNFDLESLRNNPKIQKLMNNNEVKSITDAVN